ncbi:MAG: ATP synthase F1 subunit delta [Nitrospirota bacterium]
MKTAAIANRYARALFLFAKEVGLEKKVLEQVSAYRGAIAASVAPILENPKVPHSAKLSVIARLFSEDEKRVLFLFISLLLRKGRIGYLNAIFSLYGKCYEQEMGVIRGTLLLAYPAQEEVVERLRSKLEVRLNKKVAVDVVEDARILGGFIFSTGTERIDASIIGALSNMRARLSVVSVS